MTNPVGKPLTFKTVKDLQNAIDEYFSWCDERIQHIYSPKMEKVIEVIDPAPYTMAGLARRIGISRQALSEYSHKEQYGDAIKAAREKVHEDVETRLMEKQATGAIFNLKNNFGWRDKSEIDTDITHKFEDLNDEELDRAIKARQDRLSQPD